MNICKACKGNGLDKLGDVCEPCNGDGIIDNTPMINTKNTKQKKTYQETNKPKKMKINKKTGVMEYV